MKKTDTLRLVREILDKYNLAISIYDPGTEKYITDPAGLDKALTEIKELVNEEFRKEFSHVLMLRIERIIDKVMK